MSTASALRSAVSIHASAWEATIHHWCRRHAAVCFNPRLRVGGDQPQGLKASLIVRFNPRLRVGGDVTVPIAYAAVGAFQSTPPRGRRPDTYTYYVVLPGFNPRLRVGGDKCVKFLPPATKGFNPRLRVGGDLAAGADHAPDLFQSTPPRGRRLPSSIR